MSGYSPLSIPPTYTPYICGSVQAAEGMRLGVLPPPPVLRLTQEQGSMVLYDAAMQHRGGANSGEYARPILAVHLRDNADYGATRQLPEYT